jgi:hypothetical protein
MSRGSRPPPNKPFNGTSCTRYDNGYVRNKVVFTVIGDDLQIVFCATYAPKKTAVEFYIANINRYTALDTIRDINNFCSSVGVKATGEWGRHFEEGVHEVWRWLDLPLGYIAPITRKWERRPMTRRIVAFTDPETRITWKTPEFNGDRAEFALKDGVCGLDHCDKDWNEIFTEFDGVTTLDQFKAASEKAQSYYHSCLGSEVHPIEEYTVAGINIIRDSMGKAIELHY